MAHSSDTYTAGSGQTEFDITFEIIDGGWVYVDLDGVTQDDDDYTIDIGAATMTWDGDALDGESVKIYRTTPVTADDEVVTWEDGPASPDDLALDQKKRRAHVEELTDEVADIEYEAAGGVTWFIMPFSKLNHSGVAPHDEGYRWATEVYDDYDDGYDCRILFNETDSGIPWEYGNATDSIYYMDSTNAPKYKYTIRLVPGTYVVRVVAGVYNTGTEHYTEPEITLRYSDDDAATWTSVGATVSQLRIDASANDDDWGNSAEISFSVVYGTTNSTYDYLAVVYNDDLPDPSTGYTAIYGGHIEISKIA